MFQRTVLVVVRSPRVPTWSELGELLPAELRDATVLVDTPAGRASVSNFDAPLDRHHPIGLGDDIPTGLTRDDDIDEDMVGILHDEASPELAAAAVAAGQVFDVYAPARSEAWRVLAVALARLLDGWVWVPRPWFSAPVGIYSPEELEHLARP